MIGIFDSGAGGLTVLKELKKVLPNQNFLYLGDTARVPYGDKSPQTICHYTKENTEFLVAKGVRLLIIACNTACAYALPNLNLPIPTIGVIDPGVKLAIDQTKTGSIAVLGTKATVRSKIYSQKIQQKQPNLSVLEIACPLFVPLVEDKMLDHRATDLIIEKYLSPIKNSSIDTVILGCTHYPMLKPAIQKYLGDSITLIDSASAIANLAKAFSFPSHAKAQTEFIVTDDPTSFQKMGSYFLNEPISCVIKCETEKNSLKQQS